MAGMFVTGNVTLMSMGLATILVVAVAVLGSLTVLPAVLSLLGDRVEKGRIPFLGRRRSEARDSRAWGWLVDRVLRRPVVALVLAGGALLALSIPGLGLQTKLSGIEEMPQDLASIQTYQKIQQAFPAEADPATVVVKAADVDAPAVKAAIADLQAARRGRSARSRARSASRSTRPTPSRGSASACPARAPTTRRWTAWSTCASDLLPATLDRVHGVSADVTGPAADDGRLQRADAEPDAARVRVRPRPRVHPDAGRASARSSSRSRRSCSTCCRSAPATACSSSSSRTATARACSASSPTAGSRRTCRCSSS